MKEEIKEKWISALRSGKYRQGRSLLRSPSNNFCCLGVLCDIHSKETKTDWVSAFGRFKYLITFSYPLSLVCDWAELSRHNMSKLVSMNDDFLNNFSEIADYIEKEL